MTKPKRRPQAVRLLPDSLVLLKRVARKMPRDTMGRRNTLGSTMHLALVDLEAKLDRPADSNPPTV